MSTSGWHLRAGAAVVGLAAALPFVSPAMQPSQTPSCARDGVAIGSLLRIRVESERGTSSGFCSIRCAQDWIARASSLRAAAPVRVVVTDETTGAEIDARDAVFVRSSILTSRTTGERIHAFARRADADGHAAAYRGVVLEGAERPFRFNF